MNQNDNPSAHGAKSSNPRDGRAASIDASHLHDIFSAFQAANGLKDFLPPPTVTPETKEGYLCPTGEEKKTLEWKLANWISREKVPD